MWVIVLWDNAAHRDNEHVLVIGPFETCDAATLYAEKHVKFYHVVRISKGWQ